MPAQLQILVEGESLDLSRGAEDSFYITKQLFDLSDISTRNASYSKTINIPKTPTNLILLGVNLPSKARFDDLPYKNIPCEVLISGVPMITDAYLLVGVEDVRENTISVNVYGGTAKFFTELSTNSIRDLNFSEYNIEWTLDGVLPIIATTSGICYANTQNFSNDSYNLYQFSSSADDDQTYMARMELGETGLWMFVKTLLDKIWSEMLLVTVDDSALIATLEPNYEKLAFSFDVPVIHDSFGKVDGTYTEVRDQSTDLPTSAMFTQLNFPIIIVNDQSLWSVANQRYEFPVAGFYRVKFFADGNYRNNDGIDFQIFKNGLFVASVGTPPTQGGNLEQWSVTIESTVNVVANDVMHCSYRVQTPAAAETHISLSQFIVEQEGAGRPPNIDISSLLPDISQRDFVKNIFNYLCIIPSEVNGKVQLTYFEKLRDQPRGAELQFDVSRGVKLLTSLPYARENFLRYSDNEHVQREDVNDSFTVNSLVLQKEKTAIQLMLSAADKGEAMFNSQARCVIPQYEIVYNFVNDNKMHTVSGQTGYRTDERNDIEAGDFVSYLDGATWLKRRVVSVSTDFEGNFDVTAPSTNNDFNWHHWRYNANISQTHLAVLDLTAFQYIEDGGLTAGYVDQRQANFVDSQKWSSLKISHYKLLTDSLYKPFIFEAWAIIPIATFAALNELDVLYVAEFAAYFYINKIDQWKPNQLCRITLIEIKL